MITQESAPSLAGRSSPLDHVVGDARLCDLKPELEQFAMIRRIIAEDRTLWLGSWALNNTAQRAGLKVSETKQEIKVDAEIVTANWRKNCPEIPDRNADGTNTAHSVSAIEISAPPTSSIVTCAALAGVMPRSRLRSTFSTTTIASSTTMPTASTRPNSDRLFSEKSRLDTLIA
jgi:hypothetical protein